MRNQGIFGHNEQSRKEASKRDVRRQLTEIYRHRSMYDAKVQSLLHRDVEDHEQHCFGVAKNWLLIYVPIFRASLRRVERQAATGMRSIRDYFSVRKKGHPDTQRR